MSCTIPTACLGLLGDMQDSDSPAVVTDGERVYCVHPLDVSGSLFVDPEDFGDRLLVEQSEPTLLRVLARHLGWDGCGQLRLLTIHQGAHARRWVMRAYGVHEGDLDWAHWLPAHISADLDYHEALAAAVVWYARVARATEREGSDVSGLTRAGLHQIERHYELPPLEARR